MKNGVEDMWNNQMEHIAMKSTISEIKNSLNEFNKRLDTKSVIL